MKIMTLNINGIRSGARKGFFTWLAQQDIDVVCLQEIKADQSILTEGELLPSHYHCYYHCAERKGYSGVALFAREQPQSSRQGLGFEIADTEGRYIQIDYKKFSIASVYFPSGTSGEERQTVKYHFLDQFTHHLKNIIATKKPFLLCGDWNIAHKPIDLKNWRGNQKNSGFLPEERAWLDLVFNELGFVDAFRAINTEAEQYTWWSNRGQAYAKNVGWRIDYQITTPHFASSIRRAEIFKAIRFSDHAPLIIDYDLNAI